MENKEPVFVLSVFSVDNGDYAILGEVKLGGVSMTFEKKLSDLKKFLRSQNGKKQACKNYDLAKGLSRP
jgi:hypothetical protein